jgi:exonuclease SbcC
MITKVRLKNWKSHEDSELKFAPGTNGMVGIVGSGKTSVLDAICFGLFGTFPTLQNRKLKLEDVIMKKPSAKDNAEVEVFFTVGGSDYSVKRMVEKRRGTSYSEIRKDGRMLESPATKNVTAVVEKNLKVNYELFSKAIYSEQNAIDYFLTLGKGQRMKKIDELLMIDRFEKARANAVKMTNKIIERRIGMQGSVERTDVAETKAALAKLKRSISDFDAEKSQLRRKLDRVAKKKSDAGSEVEKLREVRSSYEKLMREDSALESSISATLGIIERVEKSLKEIEGEYKEGGEDVDVSTISEAMERHAESIEELRDSLRSKQAEYESMQNELTTSKTNISFLRREKIARLERDFDEKMQVKEEIQRMRSLTGDDVSERIDNNRLALQKLIGEIEAARVRTGDLKEQLEKLSDVEGVCPVCGTSLSEEHKAEIVSEKMEELDALKEKIGKARKNRITTEEKIRQLESAARKLEEMLKDISDLEEVKQELEKSRHTLAHHAQSVDALGGQLQSLKEDMDSMKEQLEAATTSRQKLDIVSRQISDYEEHKKGVAELRQKRRKLKAEIAKLEGGASEGMLEETEQLLRDLSVTEKEAEMRMGSLDDLMAERSARVTEYERALESVSKSQKDIERLDRLTKDLKVFTEALKQTQSELRKEFVVAVNLTMNQLWQTLYPYQDFIGVRLAVEGGDYVLQLQERTTSWVNVEGVASGGERSIASLALRIAFALVLAPNLRILFLDEPTANLDSNSVKVLATTLRERISEFMDQCFIITHDDAFEEAVTGYAYRLERDKSKDSATNVVQIN